MLWTLLKFLAYLIPALAKLLIWWMGFAWYQLQVWVNELLQWAIPFLLGLIPQTWGQSINHAVLWVMPWLRMGQSFFPFAECATISVAALLILWTIDGFKFVWRKVP